MIGGETDGAVFAVAGAFGVGERDDGGEGGGCAVYVAGEAEGRRVEGMG